MTALRVHRSAAKAENAGLLLTLAGMPHTTPSPRLDDPRALLQYLYDVAVQRALPLHNTAACLPPPPKGRTLVLGAGKAGGAMAQAVEALWPADAPLAGLVVTRYHHTPPRPAGLPQRIEVVEASHPVPDAAGLAAAQRILHLTEGLTADDLVLEHTVGQCGEPHHRAGLDRAFAAGRWSTAVCSGAARGGLPAGVHPRQQPCHRE